MTVMVVPQIPTICDLASFPSGKIFLGGPGGAGPAQRWLGGRPSAAGGRRRVLAPPLAGLRERVLCVYMGYNRGALPPWAPHCGLSPSVAASGRRVCYKRRPEAAIAGRRPMVGDPCPPS